MHACWYGIRLQHLNGRKRLVLHNFAFTTEIALLITILEIAHKLNWDSNRFVNWLPDSWISAYCGETSTTISKFNFLSECTKSNPEVAISCISASKQTRGHRYFRVPLTLNAGHVTFEVDWT